MRLNDFKKKLLCWGGGDQSIVMKSIVNSLGINYDVVVDEVKNSLEFKCPLFLNSKDSFIKWAKNRDFSCYSFLITIGNPHGFIRCKIHDFLISMGLSPVTVCSLTAFLEQEVVVGEGCQIMHGAFLNTKTIIGNQCIINSNSLIEHHCKLSDGVEIGPSANLCGRVEIKNYSWVGAGATILPRLAIGSNSIIGAGSVLCKNAGNDSIYVGVPAKILKKNSYNP